MKRKLEATAQTSPIKKERKTEPIIDPNFPITNEDENLQQWSLYLTRLEEKEREARQGIPSANLFLRVVERFGLRDPENFKYAMSALFTQARKEQQTDITSNNENSEAELKLKSERQSKELFAADSLPELEGDVLTVVGKMYEECIAVADKNEARAAAIYKRVMILYSHPVAIGVLSDMYFEGRIEGGQQPERAAELLRVSASLGNAAALSALGYMYEVGVGVPKDPQEAFRLYQEAVEGGCAGAMHNLAIMYERGTQGGEEDFDMALSLFKRSAELVHDPDSMVLMGYIYERGLAKKEFEKTRGTNDWGLGIKRWGHRKAVKCYKDAMLEGDAGGSFHLGRMYEMGKGVPGGMKDRTVALRLFLGAAEKGYPQALLRMGHIYAGNRAHTWGLLRDRKKACEHFATATEKGARIAFYQMALSYLGEYEIYQEEDWDDDSNDGHSNKSDARDRRACYEGVAWDEAKGRQYMLRASEMGYEEADMWLEDNTQETNNSD